MSEPSPSRDPQHAETTLRLERTLSASRERVFAAWTRPDALKRWWLPTGEHSVPEAEVDLRVGGGYRIRMRGPSGREYTLAGTYREVSPPERLVYTWLWAHDPDAKETLVTVDFMEEGGRTRVTITHEGFADRTSRDQHDEGWCGCLERLPPVV